MFLFQHPEEYLRSLEVERERIERRNRLLRELRSATPPFGEGLARRLTALLAKPSGADAASNRQHPGVGAPCTESKEAMP